jgi:hypothetical protein
MAYSGGMKTEIELTNGNWLLVVGGAALSRILSFTIGRLAESGPVQVIDCGKDYQIFEAGRERRDPIEALPRIHVAGVYNCRQVLEALKRLKTGPEPFVVLDFLRRFQSPHVSFDERKQVLQQCLGHLDRLAAGSGGLVSMHTSGVRTEAEDELLRMVTGAARDTYHVEATGPEMAPMSF